MVHLIGELRRVLQQQNGAITGVKPRARRSEVAAQDIAFLHFRVREEPVGRLGVRPVLECKGKGRKRIEWKLLTDLSVESCAEAVEKIQW